MNNIKKSLLQILLAAVLTAALTGCETSELIKPSETGGVGRYPTPVTAETEESENPLRPVETDLSDTAHAESQAPETTAPETQSPETMPPTTDLSPTGNLPAASYTIENGKYIYHFGTPDRSGYNPSALNAMPKTLFDDCGTDTTGSWFFGKVKRDLATGEVTYVWDRWPNTLASLEKYGAIYRRHTEEKVCYLTFDCGYENGWTAPILDTLKAKNAPGIFFVTGDYVDTAEAELRRMIDEGHLVGNHTENHYNPTTLTAEVFREEIESVENKMKTKLGYDLPMLYWRPPQGATNDYVLAMSEAMGLRTVLWSYAYYDYDPANQMDYATALQRAKEALHPGCVYLLHAVSQTNAEMLGELIDWIRAQGYEIRPLCD